MRTYGNRTIKISKFDLIEKIKENQKEHRKDYLKALEGFKLEALKQLADLTRRVGTGDIDDIILQLTKPINNSENYDKILEMFEWEVDTIVELSQDEFKEYVQDEGDESANIKFMNSAYLTTS